MVLLCRDLGVSVGLNKQYLLSPSWGLKVQEELF